MVKHDSGGIKIAIIGIITIVIVSILYLIFNPNGGIIKTEGKAQFLGDQTYSNSVISFKIVNVGIYDKMFVRAANSSDNTLINTVNGAPAKMIQNMCNLNETDMNLCTFPLGARYFSGYLNVARPSDGILKLQAGHIENDREVVDITKIF